MKNLFLLPILLLSLIPTSCLSASFEDLVKRGGLYYPKFSEIPFTGNLIYGGHTNAYRNGIMHGPQVAYYDDGTLWYRGSHNNGKKEGPWIDWHPNGNLNYKGNYKNGKRTGRWVDYKSNGAVERSKTGIFKKRKED